MKKVVEIVHDIMRQAAKEGGAAADFTLGQGFDCAVLASCASIHTVYAFDVQLQAIQDARAFLAGKEGADKIRFIHDGHEQMNRYIHEPLQLGVFNFGYYPRGDHAVTTAAGHLIIRRARRLFFIEAKRRADPGDLSRP